MVKKFLITFFGQALIIILPFIFITSSIIGILGFPLLLIFLPDKWVSNSQVQTIFWIILGTAYFIVVSYFTCEEHVKNMSDKYKQELEMLLKRLESAQNVAKTEGEERELWKKTLLERNSGFPTLLSAIQMYEKHKDDKSVTYLRTKNHRAIKASEIVAEEARKRREAEYKMRNTQAIIEYYESIAPFLNDLKDEIADIENDKVILKEYNEQERSDPITNFLTKEEYRKLPLAERHQLALDRFWKRQKSNWLVGRLYERYVGYLFEKEGYDVEYVGILKGYEDLGRDLICQKNSKFVVIQCKYWSQFRTIYEKHIFQFFGTVFQYKDANPEKNVEAIFYTSTCLSDLARRFAKELGIELKEGFPFDFSYPCIKCNISKVDGEKIYHLPFDQQYDKVKIEPEKGEFYASTVEEAVRAGFRRAFKWRGEKD